MNFAQAIWLAVLLPISVVGSVSLHRLEALEFGRRLLAAGAASGLLLFIWGMAAARWQPDSPLGGSWISNGVAEVIGASIVPAIPLAIAGSVCLLGAACRKSTNQETKQ